MYGKHKETQRKRPLYMKEMACKLKVVYVSYRPHLSMLLTQIFASIVYFITEAAFHQGLNPFVYVTYRLILAGLVMVPFAYFLERKSRPKLTLPLFLELLLVSLFGTGLTFNMYFISMRSTSPTFVTSVFNTVPALTFVIAISTRMEVVNVKSPRGIAKIIGTLISLAGVMTITFYKGPAMKTLWDAPIHMKKALSIRENWVLGSILAIISCITWSSSFILLANILKKYPARLSLSAWMNFIGGVQSAVFTVCIQRKPAAWSIKMLGIDFWAILYCAIIGSSVVTFLQVWCVKEKGPVFTAMFNPLQTVIVTVLAYFVFGEKLYTGCIVGGVTVIIGLYLLLWGKEKDESCTKEQQLSSSKFDDIKATDKKTASTEKEEP